MPLYKFICESCGKEENLLLKINQEIPKCDTCGGVLQKQISRISSSCGNGGGSCSSCGGGSCSSCGH